MASCGRLITGLSFAALTKAPDIGRLSRSQGMLVGCICSTLGTRDAALGALIGIHDIAMVGSSFGVEIVGLLNNRGSL